MDGTDKLALNRDDQAGFPMDSLINHNKHSTLCIQRNVPLATYWGFVTKYPVVQQTRSYNFTETHSFFLKHDFIPGVSCLHAGAHVNVSPSDTILTNTVISILPWAKSCTVYGWNRQVGLKQR